MKILVVLVIFVAISGSFGFSKEEEDEIFNKYLVQYKPRLGRSVNPAIAKKTFIENYQKVNEHNELYRAGKVEYELDINEFSYLSYEELLALRTGTVDLASNETEDGIPAEQDRRRSGRTVAPASYSWTTVAGVVRPVQDQKQCASCWAFAAIGALEGQMAILKGKYEKLSEQEIIECAKNTYTGALFGCNGGVHYGVYNHAKDYNGVTTQAVKPYKASTSSACNVATTRTTGSKTNSYYLLPYLDESAMKEYLFSKGPLYVTYHVSNDFFNYKSGVYTDKYGYCTSSTSNNHGVLLVGYGTQSGVDYWLLKNSWGTSFGEAGYFKMQRGKNLCGLGKTVNYPYLA